MATIKAAAPARATVRAGLGGRARLGGLTTPARLRLMLAAVATASVLWGAAAAWTAGEHDSAPTIIVAGVTA